MLQFFLLLYAQRQASAALRVSKTPMQARLAENTRAFTGAAVATSAAREVRRVSSTIENAEATVGR